MTQVLETYFSNQIQAQNEPKTDELLTIQEAAKILSLSVPTIYGLVSRSEIPCMKKGKRLYFSKLELVNWVKAGKKHTNKKFKQREIYFLMLTKGEKRILAATKIRIENSMKIFSALFNFGTIGGLNLSVEVGRNWRPLAIIK